jgi:outer membrane lipoprotein-sorting protein
MKKFIMPKMYNIKSLNIKKSYAHLLCIAFFYLTTLNQASAKPELISQYRQELNIIENFLNKIENLTSDFVQNSNGEEVFGKFYLSRNIQSSGKMRIEYLAEPKILIVVNGPILSYHDIELDEITRLSTNTTPASFLTRPNISFTAKDVEVTNIKKNNNEIKVSVVKKNRKEAGEFSLIFSINPFEFIRMEVKNDLDQVITVALKNIDFNNKIPNKLFVIKNNENQ